MAVSPCIYRKILHGNGEKIWKQTTSIWIEIDILKGKNFLVGCIYRPPESSLYLPKDFNTHLSEMVTKVSNTNLEIIFFWVT